MRSAFPAASRLIIAGLLAAAIPAIAFSAQPATTPADPVATQTTDAGAEAGATEATTTDPAATDAADSTAVAGVAGPDGSTLNPNLPAPYNTWPGADELSSELLAGADVDRGKVVFQKVGICLNCHGWNGNGLGKNPRSEGLAALLRDTQLDTETLIQTVRCGIPGTPMPYHDSGAYKDPEKCYGMVMSDFDEGSAPRRGKTFPEKDLINLVAYIEAHIKGRPETSLEDCQEFFGESASKACLPLMPK